MATEVNEAALSTLAGASRSLLERGSAWRSLRRRRPPRLRCAPPTGTPMIYYLCPDYQVPSGGIRAIYRHVDLLNAAGIDAAVLHHTRGFACRWFEHSTRILGAPEVTLGPDDTLVVSEIYGPFLDRLPRQPRLVAFNQNAYLTWAHVPARERPDYGIFDAVLTVSEDSAELLRFAFPELEVAVVPNSIDTGIFHPGPGTGARRIATMPRKRPEDLELIERLLGERLADWELVRIEGSSEREAAAAMRGAPIFLALGHREGFGLPAAEAMACGALVIGFPGFGGREIFDPSCSVAVEDGDVLAAAIELAAAIRHFELDPDSVRAEGARAASLIAGRYTAEHQARALTGFFTRERQPV
jgi:glycosyltransferase involved in cell wall biosynthesis